MDTPLHTPKLARWLDWLARTRLLYPFNDVPTLRQLARRIHPMWGLGEVRARVLAIEVHTPTVRSYRLQPNRAWRGYRAGQHVVVSLETDGRRRQRAFSLSSAPTGRRLDPFVLTIQRQASGGMTEALHQQVKVGDVLDLSQAAGDFGAGPWPQRQPLLMLAAGTGITPIHSVLLALRAAGQHAPVHLIHQCRTPADAVFKAELEALAADWPMLKLRYWFSAQQGRLDRDRVLDLVPDAAQRTTLLCGPPAWMHALRTIWADAATLGLLHTEHFKGLALPPADPSAEAALHTVHTASARFVATASTPLLVAAEAAGLSPAHGCRIGICMSCQCRKRSGTVVNLRTGAVSSAPDEAIQLCVSVPRTDVELDL